ncbi:MAG: hypothetical protein J6P82_01085 [Bacteroidales bacterium]|nr:hypothetical protein [Bacteroidales bacterium]
MYLIILCLVVLVFQIVFGMADWWVLAVHFVLSGLLSLGISYLIDQYRLINKSGSQILFQGWALMYAVLNLSTVFLVSDQPWWHTDIFLIALALIFRLGLDLWQDSDCPVLCLELGAIVGALTFLDVQSLYFLIILIALLFHARSVSFRNLSCLFTGILTAVWIVYCILTLFSDPDSGLQYLLTFGHLLEWSLPVLPDLSAGYSHYVFLAGLAIVLIIYIFSGYFMYGISSLRTRAALHFISSLCLLLVFMLFFSFPACVALMAVPLSIHLMLSWGNNPSKPAVWATNTMIVISILLGVGEKLILWAIGFFS